MALVEIPRIYNIPPIAYLRGINIPSVRLDSVRERLKSASIAGLSHVGIGMLTFFAQHERLHRPAVNLLVNRDISIGFALSHFVTDSNALGRIVDFFDYGPGRGERSWTFFFSSIQKWTEGKSATEVRELLSKLSTANSAEHTATTESTIPVFSAAS